MVNTLLATKLNIPRWRKKLVSRQRLVEKINEGMGGKLTLISAPAGFGKTTLLSEWAADCCLPVAWLTLDEEDDNPKRFMEYFVAALQTIDPMIGAGDQAEMQSLMAPTAEIYLTNLINEIASSSKLKGGFVMVLDDYNEIQSPSIHSALAFIIEHQSERMHLAITTRVDPPLPIARLRAGGGMAELRQDDLRFTQDEAAIFLNQVMGLGLRADDISELTSRTEGWVVGLQLAALSMYGREADYSSFIRSFSGGDRYVLDYLVDEVLDRQPEGVQEFLLRTCILGRMCGSLCDVVLTPDFFKALNKSELAGDSPEFTSSQNVLEYLERSNLFLVALDARREWYRYHSLFGEFLCNRLEQNSPGAVPEYHLRAAGWFEQNGFAADAIRHVLAAQDFERAALLIERMAESTIKRSEFSAFLKWIQALPEKVTYKHPTLCAYYAWALLLSGGSFSEVETWLEEAEKEPGIASGRAAALRAMVSVFKGDLRGASKFSHRVVDQLPERDVFLRGVVAWNNGLAQIWGGEIEQGMRSMEAAAEIGQNSGNLLITVVALSHLAEINMLLGRLNEAESLFLRALELGIDEAGQPLPIAGMAFIGYGDLSRERNKLGVATRHIELGLELSERWGKIGALDGYICMARLKAAQGDLNGAYAEMQNAQRLAQKFDATEMDDVMVAAYQTRIWVSDGNLRDAEGWAERCGFSLHKILDDYPPLDEEGSFLDIYLRTFEYLTLTHLLIAQKQLEEGITILEAIRQTAGDRGLKGFWIEAQALLAAVLWTRGESLKAYEILEEALGLAAVQGYLHVFINAGEPMRSLLEGYKMRVAGQQIENHDEDTARLLAYADKLLDAFEGYARPIKSSLSVIVDPAIQEPEVQRQSGLIEPLSAREFEVLALVAEGCTNQEIANRLFVALSTVKSHLNHVYRKLGVSKRTQAVAKGRDFNLI